MSGHRNRREIRRRTTRGRGLGYAKTCSIEAGEVAAGHADGITATDLV
jgi:hypothetical protein